MKIAFEVTGSAAEGITFALRKRYPTEKLLTLSQLAKLAVLEMTVIHCRDILLDFEKEHYKLE